LSEEKNDLLTLNNEAAYLFCKTILRSISNRKLAAFSFSRDPSANTPSGL